MKGASPLKVVFAATLAILAGLALHHPSAAAGEPSLAVAAGGRTKVFTLTELLARSKPLEVAEDPAYADARRTYQAVPAYTLFESLSVPADAIVQFECLDGFSAPLPRDRLLNSSPTASIAYIAIEDPSHAWPALKATGPSAGPFYLVWDSPKLSGISREEWPFQLRGFSVKGSLASVYPAILPDPALPAGDAARHGFDVFVRTCFACHKLNRAGSSDMGPDLNVPQNPTEYLAAPAIRTLVRNPQNLRTWSRAQMPGFSEKVLSDAELEDVIAYLRHMAGRKQR